MLRVSKTYKSTLHIDDEPVRLVIKKLSQDEFTDFSHEFDRLGKIHTAEQLDLRPRAGEEDLTREQIEAKRYFEMSAEERTKFEADDKAEAARSNEWARAVIVQYVSAEPGQIYDEDENRELTSGEDLVRHFGARPDVLRDLVGEIFLVNRLSDEDKKKLLLLRASMRSLREQAAATGATPAPTAGSVESEISATNEGALAALDLNPSGSTDPSH